MMRAATEARLEVSAGIPVTSENVDQVDGLISLQRKLTSFILE